jgi:hypothetical protein
MELLFPSVLGEMELLQGMPTNSTSKADTVSPEAIQLTRDLPAFHGAATVPGAPPPMGSGELVSTEVLTVSDALTSAEADGFQKHEDARVTDLYRSQVHVGPSTFMLGPMIRSEAPSNETEAMGSSEAKPDVSADDHALTQDRGSPTSLQSGDEEHHDFPWREDARVADLARTLNGIGPSEFALTPHVQDARMGRLARTKRLLKAMTAELRARGFRTAPQEQLLQDARRLLIMELQGVSPTGWCDRHLACVCHDWWIAPGGPWPARPIQVLNTPNASFFDLQDSQAPFGAGVLRCRTVPDYQVANSKPSVVLRVKLFISCESRPGAFRKKREHFAQNKHKKSWGVKS